MKTAVRIAVSLISSVVIVYAISWVCAAHILARDADMTGPYVGLVMWSATGISIAAIVGLTALFYRVIS
jgi:hypothetical protein